MLPRSTRRRRLDLALDALAVAGIVAVLAFPAAAVISVAHAPVLMDPTVALPPLQHAPVGERLRDLPAFTAGGDTQHAIVDGKLPTDGSTMALAIAEHARAAFGEHGEDVLAAITRADALGLPLSTAPGGSYPARNPAVEAELDSVLGAGTPPAAAVAPLNDLAGLLVLAQVDFPGTEPDAASIAYDLYDRARRSGACESQLNLAFLLSTDTAPGQVGDRLNPTLFDDTTNEFRRAAQQCPALAPTALWLLGQFESGQRRDLPALATFRQLEQRFPGSVLGWSGEADALVRRAYVSQVPAPFAARADFRRALALYQRAASLDPRDAGIAAGEARASAGLGNDADATAQQRRAMKKITSEDAAPFRNRLVGYLEGSGKFPDAAGVEASALTATPPTRLSAGLFGQSTNFTDPPSDDELASEDAGGPVSVGVGRLRTVQFSVGVRPQLAFCCIGVLDVSFIPRFRAAYGITDAQGWCRHSRDLLLAGQPTAALADLATRCSASGNPGVFEGVAKFEQGGRRAAVAGIGGSPGRAAILEADQNLWRSAGKLERAASTTALWSRLEPTDPAGPDQAGEIAYLRKQYTIAAGLFAEAAARASGETVAHEWLKEGTARAMAGDRAAALKLLHRADAAAATFIPPGATAHDEGADRATRQAVLDSYNARLQAGDIELREHRYAAAEVQYEQALEREKQLPSPNAVSPASTARRELLFRPEVLENNQALVLVELERPADALRAIDAALAFDPRNPAFLTNRGFVEEKLGDLQAAEAAYRAALRADPTAFPAANNLGVILADDGHLSLAADALRQARAANPEYATAAFNLGLVLDRMGPSHVLESQGEFAAATRAEPELREHAHALITDEESYFSTLDLSKPVPPHWHFASGQQRTSITVAGIVFALLLFRLVKTLFQDRALEKTASRTVKASTTRLPARAANLGRRIPGAAALVAVVAVFVFPLTRSSGTTTGDFLLVGVGVAITTLAFMRLRSTIARRNAVHAQHYPCLPAVAVGGVAALFGLGFAPMPATKSDEPLPHRARWFATGLLAALTVVLIVVGKLTGVPFATQLGLVCLVMTTSALLPVEPYDGQFFEKRHVGLLIALALAVLAVLVEVGVL